MVITVFGSWLLEKVGSKALEQFIDFSNKKDIINQNFDKIVRKTSKALQKQYPDALGNSIESFFTNHEIYDELFKLLFKSSKLDFEIIHEKLDEATLPVNFIEEYITLLKKNCSEDLVIDKVLSDNQIFIAAIGIGNDVAEIAKKISLTHDEITKIKTLLQQKLNDSFVLEEFLNQYSKVAFQVLSEINFIGLGLKSHIKKNRKKIEDVYVLPELALIEESMDLTTVESRENSEYFETTQIHLKDLFQLDKHIVILGNPGSGKSLLIRYIICSIINSTNGFTKIEKIVKRIPLRIELRKYLQHKKTCGEGIVKYLAKTLETDYGLLRLSYENILEILNTRETIFFFDGLDEIFDAKDKIDIKNDIECLISSYPSVLSVITSRIIGYDEAKPKKDLFVEYKILDFNDEQISEYVNKWYLQEENDESVRLSEVKSFLDSKHNIDTELIENPLLLSLIVILFRNNLKLPESKLEIYQSCTKTLADKWDQTKDLRIDLHDELLKKKETLFADLAFWQYEILSNKKEFRITNELATSVITDSILTKLKIVDDYISANELADDFMNYALKRSLYFDNNFTHKTFLEYFTAYYIFSNIEKKHKIDDRNIIIAKYIDNTFWYIVLELLLNLIDQDQADNEIIDELIACQLEKNIESLSFFLLISNTLKNVSNSKIEELVCLTIDKLIRYNGVNRGVHDNSIEKRIYQSLLRFINISNQADKFIQCVKTYPSDALRSKEFENFVILIFEVCLVYNGNVKYDNSLISNSGKLEKLLEKNPYAFICNKYLTKKIEGEDGFIEIKLFYKRFGLNAMFDEYKSRFDNYTLINPLDRYILWQIRPENIISYENNLISLEIPPVKFFNFFKSRSIFYHFLDFDYKLLDFNYCLTVNDKYLKATLIIIFWRVTRRTRKALETSTPFDKYLKLKSSQGLLKILTEDFDLEEFDTFGFKEVEDESPF